MASHNASEQMLGYLYQVRYALLLLLESKNPSYQISIEKFDDVAFDSDGAAKQRIQLKHHTAKGLLTNTSTDLWRTLKVWIDAVREDATLYGNTDFLIITTASVPENSAASMLQFGDFDTAYKILKSVAATGGNKTNAPFYSAFLSMPDALMSRLLSKTKIIASADNIIDVESKIRDQLKFTCKPQHLDYVLERVEGWWYEQCIKALCSDNPYLMTFLQIQDKILYIAEQYKDDSLPIEFLNVKSIEDNHLTPGDQMFLDQLRLLKYGEKKLTIATKDYFRAVNQRSRWVRQGLLFPDELGDYENKLVDEWEHDFANMQEELELYDPPSEEDKIAAGRQLLTGIEGKNLRIRSKCDASYVMRGTYHILSNDLRVGWHIDFAERLDGYLRENEQSEKLDI